MGTISNVIENSRFPISKSSKGCDYVENQEEERNIVSYYATIKNERLNQYGSVFDIEWLPIDGRVYNLEENFQGFGGDKFIGRFAIKRKHTFFTRTLYGLPKDSDIWYSEYTNVAFPTYYFDTTNKNYDAVSLNTGENPLITTIVNMLVTGLAPSEILSSTVETKPNIEVNWWSFIPVIGVPLTLLDYVNNRMGFNKYLSHIGSFFRSTLLDPNSYFKKPLSNLDCQIKNYDENSKLFSTRPLSGKIYLYSYGIPYFIVESDYNVDLRYAQNNTDGDFYPRQQDLDFWLQEKNVSPRKDNTFYYNTDYSKQNKEQVILSYDINYNPDETCKVERPNRIIYSLQGNEVENDDFKDPYLFNLALDYKDFDFKNGKLKALHQIENDKILVQFENDSKLFSAYQTLNTDQSTIIIGSGGIFNNRPLEFSKPTLGYFGTQHRESISTEFGRVSVDSKRGQVFLLSPNGTSLDELSKTKKNWFKENLPFTLLQYFDIDVDDNYSGIGISMGYDRRFNSVYITKLDYQPLKKEIKYLDNKFYYLEEEISLNDRNYFCNKSFTIAYNFYRKTWIFHSIAPNYYVDGIDWFITGLNASSNQLSSAWIHNISNKSYQVLYGKLQPFIVETISKFTKDEQYLFDIQFKADKIRVHNEFDKFYIRNETPFNKAIIYNDFQNTGELNLFNMKENDAFYNFSFPKKYFNKTEIIVNNKGGIFKFADVKNNIKSETNNIPMFLNSCNNVNKFINLQAFNMLDNTINKHLKGNQFKIRLINDVESNYKIVHKLTTFNNGAE